MSLLQLSQYNFRKKFKDRYLKLGSPLNTAKCNCEYCAIDPDMDMAFYFGSVNRGWRKLLDDLFHDLEILYGKDRGAYRIYFESIYGTDKITLDRLIIFNSNNTKDRHSKNTYAHNLVKAVNKTAQKTCTICSKPAIDKFVVSGYSFKVPRCSKHKKDPLKF